MNLDRYLTRESEKKLAKRVGTSISTINRLKNGKKRASVAKALSIEMASDGRVRAEDVPMSPGDLRTVRAFKRYLEAKVDGRRDSA